jgi:hypothetical protein
VGADVGTLVGSLGNTVTNAGGLVNPNGANGYAPIPGLIVSLVGGSQALVRPGPPPASGGLLAPLNGVLSSLGLGSSPLGSVTTLLGSTPLSGALGGATTGTSNPLSSLTGALGGGSGSAGGNPLAPVTGLVATLTGTLTLTGTTTGGNAGTGTSVLSTVLPSTKK